MNNCCAPPFPRVSARSQGISTHSKSDSAAKQKSHILQCEEGEKKVCKICDTTVYEAALWPLDQTQGTCL